MPAKTRKTTVLIGTIMGLRRCSTYLITLANRKAPPIIKQAVLTKSDSTLTGVKTLVATVPTPEASRLSGQSKRMLTQKRIFIFMYLTFLISNFAKININ